MTLSGTIPVEQSVADGITATFSYGFKIDVASDLFVMQDAVIASPGTFSVTGVGNASGGTLTFTAAPPLNTVISRFRVVDFGQTTSYAEGDAFLEQDHEQSVDTLAMQITQLVERFQRIPIFPQQVNGTIRGMALPLPEALKLLQWNSTADGLTNANSTILTVTPLPGGGAKVEAQASVAVNASASALELVATSLVPAGAVLDSLLYHCATSFGTSNGLTSVQLGTRSAPQRFGRGLSIVAGNSSNGGQWANLALEPAPSALDAVLGAETGPFDAVGQAIITAVYFVYTPPIVVP